MPAGKGGSEFDFAAGFRKDMQLKSSFNVPIMNVPKISNDWISKKKK